MQRQPVFLRQQASHKLIERLLAEHDIALRRFIRVRLGAQQDCDDVLQEVYVRLSQINDLPEKLADRLDTARNYLMQIASNLLIDRARRAQVRHAEHHVSTADVETHSTLTAPDRDLHSKRQLQQVESALAKVKSLHRQAFLLHRVDGLSYREIGDQLGISVSTVEKYIASALLAVRQTLRDDAEAHS
ncbi:MAG TPA: RNA polymerase sigma factor [Pseudidiomarina sp.]|nr:RNA polymerase sigma factor [Pseudidiomarina sp.]